MVRGMGTDGLLGLLAFPGLSAPLVHTGKHLLSDPEDLIAA